MCGIAGIISKKTFNQSITKDIKILKESIFHRGPDYQNDIINYKNNFALCSTRLAIIDTNEKSNQPFVSEKGNIICFNGEIYNYKEIKKKLINKNISFKTNCDTEVILSGYEYYGEKILELIDGMFAFIIWDEKKKKFFGARDRYGIKPFVYYQNDEKFLFSSEVKSLNKILNKTKCDNQSILNYCIYGVINQPKTIFEDIKFLEAGHFFYLDAKLNFVVHNYYNIDADISVQRNFKSRNDYYEELFAVLNTNLISSMISDVDMASFLSGGVDSSILTKILSENFSNNNLSIHLKFKNNSSDYPDQKIIRKLKNIRKYKFEYLDTNIIDELSNYINCLDQPTNDGLNTYLVSKKAAKFAKVALSGLGADELFVGYNIINDFINSRNFSIKNLLFSNFHKIKPLTIFQSGYFSKLNEENFILLLRRIINNQDIQNIFNSEFLKKTDYDLLNQEILKKYNNNLDTVEQKIFSFENKNYLINTLLRDSDNSSMANSIELRPCFLTKELVKFTSQSISYSKKISKENKFSLKLFYKKIFKEKYKNKKIGFEIPINSTINILFRNYKLQESVNLNKIFNKNYLIYLDKNHKDKNFCTKVYSLYVLDSWLDTNHLSLN